MYTIPVSYTHLDVYKRQGFWSSHVCVVLLPDGAVEDDFMLKIKATPIGHEE